MIADDVDQVWREINRIETCMMTTHHGRTMRARPMQGTADRTSDTIWFVSNRAFPSESGLNRDPRVCLTYVDHHADTYLSISGRAKFLEDRAKIRELWRPVLDTCFLHGPDDPHARLIAVCPEVAEVWNDAPSSELFDALDTLTARSHDDPGSDAGSTA